MKLYFSGGEDTKQIIERVCEPEVTAKENTCAEGMGDGGGQVACGCVGKEAAG